MQTGEKFEPGIVAIVRSAGTLQAVSIDTESLAESSEEDGIADLTKPARIDYTPFEQSVTQRGKSLLAAWDLLAGIVDWNAETLKAVLIVLIDTVPIDTIPTPPPYPFDVATRCFPLRERAPGMR